MQFEEDFRKIYGFFYKRINNLQDVEDATMIIFGKIQSAKLDRNQNLDWPYTWQMCKNYLVDFYRKSARIQSNETSFEQDHAIPKYSINYQLDINHLHSLIDTKLTEEESRLIKKVYFDGVSYEEISNQTGILTSTLRKRVSRIIQKLKKFYR